jgi:hypothetical protein
MVSDGWYNIEESGGEPFRWVQGQQGRLCVFSPLAMQASLSLDAISFSKAQSLRIEVTPQSTNGSTGTTGQVYSGTIPPSGTTVQTRPIEFPAGMTEVRIVPQEEGVTPQSLDPNARDDRVLTVGFKRVRLEPAALK